MVIGLFAMSEALIQLTARSAVQPVVQLRGHFFQGFMEVFRYKRTLYGSSFFGIFCGILPGVGEFLAQQVSYVVAKRFSPKATCSARARPKASSSARRRTTPSPPPR
jgi:putative tricarboxylic transport membrane protein